MAFDREFLAPLFGGQEDAEERIGKILSGHGEAVIGLTRNRDSLKAEKEKLAEERKALQEKLAELEAANAELAGKLESGPGDREKLLQAEVERWKGAAEKAAGDMKAQLAERDAAIGTLKAEHHRWLVGAEFRKLLDAAPGLYPELREDLQKSFFADNPVESFEFVEYGGEKSLRNKDSRTLGDLLSEKLNSPAGKHYRQNLNGGGGAQGSSGTRGDGTVNPWKKETRNVTEQMRIEQNNPAQAALMKAQAGVK